MTSPLDLIPAVTPQGIAARAGAWLLGKAWPIVGILGIAGSLYLGFQLITTKADLRSCNSDKAGLVKQNTQLTRDLAQAQTNVGTLQIALNQQNAQLRSLSQQSIANFAALGKGVDSANRNSAAADQRVRNFLAYNPEGADVCARVLQIDRKFVQSLLDEKVTGR